VADPVTIWTFDWVPDGPRGFVRDLRLRWACEETGTPYRIETVAFEDRHTHHGAFQPFGQVPMLLDGDLHLFESGACLMHLARKSDALVPQDPAGEVKVLQWVLAALNSIEMVSMPWVVLKWSEQEFSVITDWLGKRLDQMEAVLSQRDWLVGGRFTAADLMMADVLRVDLVRNHGNRPASEAFVARMTDRPAFRKAHADQMDHFRAADAKREETSNG
jgi:glutathione S-transferase